MLTTLAQRERGRDLSFQEHIADVWPLKARKEEKARPTLSSGEHEDPRASATVIWPLPIMPLRSAKREAAGGLGLSCGLGVWPHSPSQAPSLLSQGVTRKLGNSRDGQLLAQGNGSAGARLP